jgi:hypothetical protein
VHTWPFNYLIRVTTGIFILENTHPGGRGGYQPMSFGEKYEKAKRKRERMYKKKEEREKKMRKGEVKE